MTMKEKADSYIEKMIQQSLGSPINALSMGYEDGYKDGMEEAFRWRDVREELPKNQGIVLVKTDENYYATTYFHGESGGSFSYACIDSGRVTKWRPIEMEDL